MGSGALQHIYQEIRKQGQLYIDLKFGYMVIFSSLQGNLPINNTITGSILDLPVNLKLDYAIIPNTKGNYPVNNRIFGTIGDTEIEVGMSYKMVFSAIAGNIPVNTGLFWKWNGKEYSLYMPYTLLPAAARGAMAGAGGGPKKKRISDPKFKGGKMIEVDEMSGGDNGISQEAGRPVCTGVIGKIEDVKVDLNFSYTYYCNTSSGRNPINNRIKGFLSIV